MIYKKKLNKSKEIKSIFNSEIIKDLKDLKLSEKQFV